MVKLSRLTINAFRQVRRTTALRFRAGQNVLVGKVGSGRTTLLELVAAAATMDFSPLAHEAFDVAFEARFDEDEVTAHLVNRASEGGAHELSLELEIKSGAEDALGRIKVEAGPGVMKIFRGAQMVYEGAPSFDARQRPGMGALIDLARQIATASKLDQVRALLAAGRLSRARRFDEGLEFLRTITGPSGEVYLLPSLPGAPRQGVSFWIPDELITAAVARVDAGERGTIALPLATAGAFEGAEALGLRDGRLELDVIEAEEGGPQRLGNLRLTFANADGARLPHAALPYGRQRLLSLHLYLAGTPHLAVVDELSNGLDHAGLASAVAALGGRQAFVACASPREFEHLDFEDGAEVRRAITLCRAGEDGKIEYEQLDEKPANAFFRSWKAGPQEFALMLRQRGLA